MKRSLMLFLAMFITATCFGQVKSMVGILKTEFHPGITKYFLDAKEDFLEDGEDEIAESIDAFLSISGGTGFVYVGPSGENYILTNYHVVSSGHRFSIEFEKEDGSFEVYENLRLIGVDKDLDLALLEFENQDKPFSKGLPFYDKPLQDGDGVFSAGFPALGNQRLWQLGRGFVTNATARIEDLLDPELSTLIQHSAQIDAGNSGGPLMVRPSDNDPQMYVVGINTWKADSRQDVNLSLPADKIIQFMEAKTADVSDAERDELFHTTLAAFSEGLHDKHAVYPHIADYLSSNIVGVNGFDAMYMVGESAPNTVAYEVLDAFFYSPADGLRYAVSWFIEDALRNEEGRISLVWGDADIQSVSSQTDASAMAEAKVRMTSHDREFNCVWRYAAGYWQLESIEGLTGDTLAETKAEREKYNKSRNVEPRLFYLNGGYALSFSDLPSVMRASAYLGLSDSSMFGVSLDISSDKDVMPNLVSVVFRSGLAIPTEAFEFLPFGGFGISAAPFSPDAFAMGGLAQAGIIVCFGPSKNLTAELALNYRLMLVNDINQSDSGMYTDPEDAKDSGLLMFFGFGFRL